MASLTRVAGIPPHPRHPPRSARSTWRALAGLALLSFTFILASALAPASRQASGLFAYGVRISVPFASKGPPAPDAHLDLPPYRTGGPSAPAAQAVRLANGRIPFVPGGLAIPLPFLLANANPTDWARAVDCLAAAAYYEAGQGDVDERAVAQVVLNRVRHPAFPHTVCGVIFQQSDQATGCQFTFACDGSMTRRRPSPEAWARARSIAQNALNGRTEPRVGHSTHYHTDWVLPVWSQQMDKIAAVNTHLFFRWRGARGEPATFAARYAGGESRIAKMAMLSPAHGMEPMAAPPVAEALSPPASFARQADAPAGPERLADHVLPPDPDIFLVTLDPAGGPDSFVEVARKLCGARGYCKLIGWTDGRRKADRLPMPGSAIDAIAFTYTRSAPSAPSPARWNCAAFPRSDPAQCLHRGL